MYVRKLSHPNFKTRQRSILNINSEPGGELSSRPTQTQTSSGGRGRIPISPDLSNLGRGPSIDISGYGVFAPTDKREAVLLTVEDLSRFLRASRVRMQEILKGDTTYPSLFHLDLNGLNLKKLSSMKDFLNKIRLACGFEVQEDFRETFNIPLFNEVKAALLGAQSNEVGLEERLKQLSNAAIKANEIKAALIASSVGSEEDGEITNKVWFREQGIQGLDDSRAAVLSSRLQIELNEILIDELPLMMISEFNRYSGAIKEVYKRINEFESRKEHNESIVLRESLKRLNIQLLTFRKAISQIKEAIEARSRGNQPSGWITQAWLQYANDPELPTGPQRAQFFRDRDGVQGFIGTLLGYKFANIPNNFSPHLKEISLVDLNKPEVARAFSALTGIKTHDEVDSGKSTGDKKLINGAETQSTKFLIQKYVDMRMFQLSGLEKRIDGLLGMVGDLNIEYEKPPQELAETQLEVANFETPQKQKSPIGVSPLQSIAEEIKSIDSDDFMKLRWVVEQKKNLFELGDYLGSKQEDLQGLIAISTRITSVINRLEALEKEAVQSLKDTPAILKNFKLGDLAKTKVLLEKARSIESKVSHTERQISEFIRFLQFKSQKEGVEFTPVSTRFNQRWENSKVELAKSLRSLLPSYNETEIKVLVENMTNDYMIPHLVGLSRKGEIYLLYEKNGSYGYTGESKQRWLESFPWNYHVYSLEHGDLDINNKVSVYQGKAWPYRKMFRVPFETGQPIELYRNSDMETKITINDWRRVGETETALLKGATDNTAPTGGVQSLPSGSPALPNLSQLKRSSAVTSGASRGIEVKEHFMQLARKQTWTQGDLRIVGETLKLIEKGEPTDILDYEKERLIREVAAKLKEQKSSLEGFVEFTPCVASLKKIVGDIIQAEQNKLNTMSNEVVANILRKKIQTLQDSIDGL